jgi:hypothetical protein
MSRFALNIRELIRFYDDDPEAGPHSNAVKTLAGEELGLALLERYLVETARSPARVYSPCTTVGARLDGWIKVDIPAPVLFQVEVKSWSMHGYGSGKQRLSVDAPGEALAAYKKWMWSHYWDAGTFKPKSLKKVLKKMRLPKGELVPIESVACIWTAVHPDGLESPFFTVQAKDADFREVHVFSMSAYLRKVLKSGTTTLELDLTSTGKRINYLNTLFALRT